MFRHNATGTHKQDKYTSLARKKKPSTDTQDVWKIGGVHCLPAKLVSDGKWWIVAAFMKQEELMDDIGPFDTAKQAAVYCTLMDEL